MSNEAKEICRNCCATRGEHGKDEQCTNRRLSCFQGSGYYAKDRPDDYAALEARCAKMEAALRDAVNHLRYCGYGDEWEREKAKAQGLPGRLNAALPAEKEEEESALKVQQISEKEREKRAKQSRIQKARNALANAQKEGA